MGLDVRISGAEQLHHLAALFREIDKQGLGREMSKALGEAVAPIGKAITAEAGRSVPSGYRSTLTASLRHRRSVRNTRTQASVRITTSAKGEREPRDLPAINRGALRHPVFGRTRQTKQGPKKNPWATTRVRAGFHDRGTSNASAEAEKQLLGVLDKYQQIVTGK